MADDDLDQIRAYYVTLREVIILNSGGGTTPNRARGSSSSAAPGDPDARRARARRSPARRHADC